VASVFRGVELDGGPTGIRAAVTPEEPTAGEPVAEIPVDVGPTDAHVYTECARIWNPIHTDAAVAHAAGLPSPILHGTATLARAVSVLSAWSGNAVWTASRIACRFSAMVPNGTMIVIRVLSATRGRIRFDVRNHAGDPAIRDGVVEFATPG
jgi:acyl dehydratase